MELRQIRYFVVLAEELHFGRAASKIPIAQSALSQQIKKLEEELNGQLFYRDTHQVLLTEVGEVFLKQATSILTAVHEAEAAVEQTIRGEHGTLRIGFVEAALWDILPTLIHSYKQKYPHVDIIPHQMTTAMQLDALMQDQIQLGIVGSQRPDPAIQYHLIREERCLLALPPTHPLTKKETIAIHDLVNEPFVAIRREAGAFYFDQFIQTCMANGFSPTIALTADNMQSLLAFVAAGMGIALIHESSKNSRSDLCYREVEGNIPTLYNLFFAWKHQNPANALTHFLNEALPLFPDKPNAT